MSAWSGARTGWVGYNAKSLIVRPEWDSYQARLSRYAIYQGYHDATQYSPIERFSASLKEDGRLYRHIRSIYNPTKRLIDLYVANVYKGSVDLKDLGAGAVPLEYDNSAFEPALTNVLRWSNLGQQLSTYVRSAALLGDAFWGIVDDPVRRRVRLELLHPNKVRDLEFDEVGNVRAAVIEYEKEEAPNLEQYQPSRMWQLTPATQGKTFTYTQKISKTDSDTVQFETFKNGAPWAFHEDPSGRMVSKWDMPYGFVPLKPAFFEPGDDRWGANAFYAFRRLIDEINDQASIIDDTVRRVIEPLLKARGVTAADKVDTVKDERTGITVLYISNKDGDIEAVQIPVDLAAASVNIEALQKELERNMPLLALQRIREGGNLTAPGVRVGYSDAISQVENARQNLDPSLVAALQMACTIGAVGGYDGFAGFNAGSFDAGDMELTLKPREVISDSLSKQERISAYGTVANLPPGLQRKALEDMDVSKKEIDAIIAEAQAQQQQAQQQISQNDANSVDALLAKLQGDGQTTPVEQQPQTAVNQRQAVNA